MLTKIKCQILFFIILFASNIVHAQDFNQAKTRIIDGVGEAITGDTLKIDGLNIQLEFIIAPKIEQECLDKEIGRYKCGIVSKNILEDQLKNNIISCFLKEWSDDGKIIGQCRNKDNEDISELMLFSGWSIVKWFDRNKLKEPVECSFDNCKNIPEDYWYIEKDAVKNKRGLWSSKFDLPWRE